MKKIILPFVTASLLLACNSSADKKEIPAADSTKKDSVTVISETPKGYDTIEVYHYKGAEPYINSEFIKSATEKEKALLAYYCYFFSSNCKDTKHCALTEALGLGEQNSKEHKALVQKWFTDDETLQLAKEGGRITPNGTKNMAWYEELKLVKKGTDLIVVRYNSAWKTENQEGKGRGTDEYQLGEKQIKVIGRSHEDI